MGEELHHAGVHLEVEEREVQGEEEKEGKEGEEVLYIFQ